MEIHPGSNLPAGAVGAFALWRSRLHLTLEAKASAPIELEAKTVWVEKQEPGKLFRNGIAVCFDKMEPEQQEMLEQFIQSLEPDRQV